MKCENYFCIYEKNGSCTLTEITLNISGACDDCIYPSLNEAYLTREKQKLLKHYEEQEKRD